MSHFLHIDDFSADELRAMLLNAAKAKTAFYNRDIKFKPFDGWSMAMIFTKPSARTRVSFETVLFLSHGLCAAAAPAIQHGKEAAS
jgi:ornithine carbamoyltransferase